MKICAILPIKHNSTRVPGKNYRDFNGKPLFMHILNTLLDCDVINNIVIDTNSDTIKDLLKKPPVGVRGLNSRKGGKHTT